LEALIKQLAHGLGFDLVGITSSQVQPEVKYFESWINSGYHASMDYLSNRTYERLHPESIFENLKSIIVCGLNYNTRKEKSVDLNDQAKGWISRYAWGTDYHIIMENMLDQLIEQLQQEVVIPFQFKKHVDTGPILERVYAYHAGIGWFGKNSCILNKKFGSYFFIGVILTDLDLNPDQLVSEHCGDCNLCLEACPTQAIVSPKVIDSRKCISYLTIENRNEISNSLKQKIGNHIFGCDICQEVCPWNSKSTLSSVSYFKPRDQFFKPDLKTFYNLVNENYPNYFQKSPLKRAKQKGLLRNTRNAIENSDFED